MLRRECSSSPHLTSMDGRLCCCLAWVDIEYVDNMWCFLNGLAPMSMDANVCMFAELTAGECKVIAPESPDG